MICAIKWTKLGKTNLCEETQTQNIENVIYPTIVKNTGYKAKYKKLVFHDLREAKLTRRTLRETNIDHTGKGK